MEQEQRVEFVEDWASVLPERIRNYNKDAIDKISMVLDDDSVYAKLHIPMKEGEYVQEVDVTHLHPVLRAKLALSLFRDALELTRKARREGRRQVRKAINEALNPMYD
ncbi:hypothetical protein H1O16_gp198 [Burkholderia phage BcepSaruman]|uniref:Uncharacterized protein n=1 Tax=Burkholderia phage BcepSaruman TaxID=2530032 RepID=A0A4D5ZCS1_9CAUD|nr:hypothetical protein H1O16_gp198 [Burkholderia phage BcepSaruman]QBX06611.1 hypothetical protein BcepSaruman_198 [Burkholderia phage BcepSaruman]